LLSTKILLISVYNCYYNEWYHISFWNIYFTWIRSIHLQALLLTFSGHLSSPLIFSGVRVARPLVFCVMFCRSLFVPLVVLLKQIYTSWNSIQIVRMLRILTIIYFRHGIHWWRYEKFEDTKGVIRSRKSKKERQRNDQKICFKRTTRVRAMVSRTTFRKYFSISWRSFSLAEETGDNHIHATSNW
jgi:hypothetical protein